MDASLKEKFLSKNLWIRLGFIIFLGIISLFFLYIFFIILIIAITQTVIAILKGSPEKMLLHMTERTIAFFAHMLGFVMYNTEIPPFPFSAFPGSSTKEEIQ